MRSQKFLLNSKFMLFCIPECSIISVFFKKTSSSQVDLKTYNLPKIIESLKNIRFEKS